MILPRDMEVQIPLIHFVESDDLYLEAQEDVFWFDLLRDLDWPSLRAVAARYYEALWQFNEQQARARAERSATAAANPETPEEATYRLLFERPTLCEDAPILHEPEPLQPPSIRVNPATLRPGQTPPRFAGRAPKCFFAMFKAFMGVAVCGTPPEPQFVRQKLIENPSFARSCGFTLPDRRRGYRQSHVPSLRKLEQFDQIMSNNGLWGEAAVEQVARNLKEGFVKLESTLVHDTTHYQAFSSMRVVDLPEDEQERSSDEVKPDETKGDAGNPTTSKQPKKRKKRKSHPKTTKSCKCPDRANCPHPWINADEGAGTVVKSTKHFGRATPILDVMHALSYAYSAAEAGGDQTAYPRGARWIWRGQVERVIGELRDHQDQIGKPPADASPSDPREPIHRALVYYQNHQSRMNYPEYRRLGLPLTSSHIESTIKQINRRVKGSEKFWSRRSSEAILQLRADYLSDSAPIKSFWLRHQTRQTGTNAYSQTT